MMSASAVEANRTPWVMSSSVRSLHVSGCGSITVAEAPTGVPMCMTPGIATVGGASGMDTATVDGIGCDITIGIEGACSPDTVVVALTAATGAGSVANAADTAAAAAVSCASSRSIISAQVSVIGVDSSASWNWLESSDGVIGCESSSIGGVGAVNSTIGGGDTRIVKAGRGSEVLGGGRLRGAGTRATLGGARRRKIPRPVALVKAENDSVVGGGKSNGGTPVGVCWPDSFDSRSLGRAPLPLPLGARITTR